MPDAPAAAANQPPETDNKVGLVIAAHPDDPDFGAGGTAALWTTLGWQMHYLVVTNGAKGSADPEMTSERLVPMREEEQRNAAAELGVLTCTFLGAEDGELEYSREMLGGIVRTIRRLKPHAIFTHSPEIIHRRVLEPDPEDPLAEFRGFVNHRDHRRTGEMAIDAVYPTARDRLNFPEHLAEGLETHNVAEMFIWGNRGANFDVDVTEMLDTKIRALTRHVSQFGDRGEDFIKNVRDRWRSPDGRFYERFERVSMPF